jgi:hypothetical protein
LSNLNVLVVPSPVVLIRSAQTAFTEDGGFVDQKLHEQLKTLVERSVHLANAIQSSVPML